MRPKNMMIKLLTDAYSQKNLIGITTQEIEWDELIIGYIKNIKDNCIIINEVDEYGNLIGDTLVEINDILHICYDSWYLKDMYDICDNKHIFNPNSRKIIWREGEKLIPYLNELKENGKISRLLFDDDYYVIGIILGIDTEFCFIKNIGQNGKEEGLTCYRIKDIKGLKYDDLSMQKVQFLYKKYAGSGSFGS